VLHLHLLFRISIEALLVFFVLEHRSFFIFDPLIFAAISATSRLVRTCAGIFRQEHRPWTPPARQDTRAAVGILHHQSP